MNLHTAPPIWPARLSCTGHPLLFLATILALVALDFGSALPAHAVPAGFQEYLILGNETQILEMFRAIQNNPKLPGQMASVITVVATTDYQMVYYDHWEDGYEPDIQNPVQASTEIYGTSGSPSGMLKAGDIITLNSDGGEGIRDFVPVPRGRALRYDGADRLLSIGGPIDIVHSLWPAADVRIGGAWEIYPVGAWATGYSYIVPVGEDLYDASIEYMADFQRVYLQIQALEDNTTVQIDNGQQAISIRLDLGQTYSNMGYRDSSQDGIPSIPIYAGTTLLSNKPIQGGLVTGRTTNQSRLFSLVPDADWSTEYVAPIPRTNDNQAEVYLYNPGTGSTAITAYDRDRPQGTTFALPAEATLAYRQPAAVGRPISPFSALRLRSSDPIWAVASADAGEQDYDWGFSLVPTRFAGREYYVSWAPGDDLTADPPPDASPVWIAPLHDNTLFQVTYNPRASSAPDLYFVLDALTTRRVADPDGNSTSMHILADKPFVAVWGEDPAVADVARGLDMGYPILPLDGAWQDKVLVLTKSPDVQTLPPEGGTLGFALRAETSDYPVSGLEITDTLPLPCKYLPDSARVTYPDGRTVPVEPTIVRQDLWWPLNADLLAHQALTVAFQARCTPPGPLGQTAHDDMESGGYAGGEGWTGPWIADQSACVDDCVLNTTLGTPHSGLHHLYLTESGAISRATDLAAFQHPTLRFWHKVDQVPLRVRVYDGTNWTTLLSLDKASASDAYMAEQLDLSPYRSSAFALAFASSGTGEIYIDDVQLFDAASGQSNSAQATGVYHGHRFTSRDRARIVLSPLSIQQHVDRDQAAAGDKLAFTLRYSNNSATLTATHTLIRHNLPPNTTFVSASPSYLYQPEAHTLIWGRQTPKTMAPGSSETLTATVVIDQWTTDGQILHSQAYLDSDQTPETASNLTQTIIHAPKMLLTKHGPDRASPGEIITYTIAYTNTGQVSATGVIIHDLVPPLTGYQVESMSLDTGSGYRSLTDAEDDDEGFVRDHTVVVSPGRIRGRIAPGERGRIRFSVRVEPTALIGENIANHATLLRDYARPQNSALLLTTITDIALTKHADRQLTAPSETLAYTLTLQTSGSSAPTEVYVQDAIPAHTSYLAGSANVPPGFTLLYSTDYGSTWSAAPPADPQAVTHLRWYTPIIRATESAYMGYRVQVQNPLSGPNVTICNQANAWSTRTPRLSSNRICIETVDLALTKTYAGPPAVPGQVIPYTLNSANRGSATALAATLRETVPLHTTFVSGDSSPGWSCADGAPAGTVCTLSLGNLALGAIVQNRFAVLILDPVPPGANALVNQAQLSSQQGFSVTQTHETDIHARAELIADKSDGTSRVSAGSLLTYTLTLHNTGNRGAASIVFTDTLPQYTTYLPGSASGGGRYDPLAHQIVWTLDTFLPGGQSITRTLNALVQDPLPLDALYLTNTLQICDDRANGDTDAGNVALDVNTIERHPALRIIKRGPDTAEISARIVYTLTVGNVSYTPTGLSAARVGDGSPVREIHVQDWIAHSVHYVSGDDGDGVLEFGEAWVYTASYTVTAADRGELTNVATVRGIDINGDTVTSTGSHTTRIPGRTLFLPVVLYAP